MAARYYYIGSMGPFWYDDAVVYHGTAVGQKGLHTDGPIFGDRVRSNTPPIIGIDTLRLADIWGIGLLTWTITDATAARNFGVDYTNGTAYDMIVLSAVELEVAGGGLGGTTRITSVDSPYTVLADDEVIFCDTDGGNILANLPAGIEGKHYKLINCGTSGNTLTIDPNGIEQINGAGAGVAINLADGIDEDIHFNATEGWY